MATTFDAGTVHAELELGKDSFQRDLRSAKSQLTEFEKAKHRVPLILDTGQFNTEYRSVQTKLLNMRNNVIKPKVVLDYDDKAAKAKFATTTSAMSDKKVTINADADTASATAKFGILRAMLDFLTRRREIKIDVDAGGAMAQLAAIKAATAGVGASAGGATSAFGGMFSMIMLIAMVAAPAIGVIATAIAALPALIFVAVGALGAIMLGMDGIKRAGESLKPVFTDLKAQVSESFEKALAPAVKNIADILPQLTGGFQATATALGGMATQITNMLNTGPMIQAMQQAFQGVWQVIQAMSPVMTELVRNTINLANSGLVDFMMPLAGLLRDAAVQFGQIIERAKESGVLTAALGGLADTIGILVGFFNLLFEQGLIAFAQLAGPLNLALAQFGDILIAIMPALTALTEAGLKVLNPLMAALFPIIQQMVPIFGQFAGVIADILLGAINTLIPALQILAPIFQVITDVLAFLSPILGPLAVVLGIIAAAFWLVGAAVSAFTVVVGIFQLVFSPLGIMILLVIGIIALLAAAVYLIITNWGSIADFFVGLWNTVVNAFMTAWNGIINFLTTVWNFILNTATTVWNGIVNFFTTVFTGIWNAIVAVWNFIIAYLVGTWNNIVATAMAIWNGIVAFFTGIFNFIYTIITTVWNGVLNYFTSLFNAHYVLFMTIWTAISVFFTTLWNNIRDFFVGIWDAIIGFVTAQINGFVTFWTTVWNVVSTFWTGIWNAIWNTVSSIWNTIVSWVTAAINAFVAFWTNVWNGIVAQWNLFWNTLSIIVSTVWGIIWGYIQGAINTFLGWWNGIWTSISNFFTGIWTAISNAVSLYWGILWGYIQGAIATFQGWWDGVWNTIVTTFEGIWNKVVEIATRVWEGVKQQFKDGVNAVIDAINWLTSKINVVLKFLLIPEIPSVPRMEAGGTVGLAAGGPVPGGGIGAGFKTNGPTAIVGEGRKQYPEYVIPTDPKYRSRAKMLYGMLGQDMGAGLSTFESGGQVPMLEGGGIIGWLGDAAGAVWRGITAASDFVGGMLGDAVKWMSGSIDELMNASIQVVRDMLPNGFVEDTGVSVTRKSIEAVKKMIDDFMAKSVGGGVVVPPGPILAMLRATAAQFGWAGGAQWDALMNLLQRESGFDNTAQNPTSSAYGIFQFINSTWAETGIAKTSDPGLQILAGLRYIKGRYNDPIGAWAFWQRHHSYDAGGELPPGFNVAYNGLRHAETIVPLPPTLVNNALEAARETSGSPEQMENMIRAIVAETAPEREAQALSMTAMQETMENVHDLLERRGAGATLTVEDRSGDPKETARQAILGLRLS